jgi:hypothetical protein
MLKFYTTVLFRKKLIFFKALFFFKFFFKKKNKIRFKLIKSFKPLFKLIYKIKKANVFKFKMVFSFTNSKGRFIFSFFKKIIKFRRFFFFLKNTTSFENIFFFKKSVHTTKPLTKRNFFFKKFLLNSYNSKTFNWLFIMFKFFLIVSSLILFKFLITLYLFVLFGIFGLAKVFFNENSAALLKLRIFSFSNINIV